MQFDMKVASRTAVGKGVARSLRREGKIPGILYGQKDSLPVILEPSEIRKILHSESGSNALLNLNIATGNGDMKRTAMLRDYQVDPITGSILHADLFEVAMDKPVRVRVPVTVTEGTPIGVAEGGVLQHNLRELHIECLPGDIPASIVVDPSNLRVNQGIHVKEVPVSKGCRILDDPEYDGGEHRGARSLKRSWRPCSRQRRPEPVLPSRRSSARSSKRAQKKKREQWWPGKPARSPRWPVPHRKPRIKKRRKRARNLRRRKRSSVAAHRRSWQSRRGIRQDATQCRLCRRRSPGGRSRGRLPPARVVTARIWLASRRGPYLR